MRTPNESEQLGTPPGEDFLTGISGIRADDVWATGFTITLPLLEQWDGHEWSNVDNPASSIPDGRLYDVEAFTRTDAWAIGYPNILMHWNGRMWKKYHRPH